MLSESLQNSLDIAADGRTESHPEHSQDPRLRSTNLMAQLPLIQGGGRYDDAFTHAASPYSKTTT